MAEYPAPIISFLTIFQRTISITKMTRARKAAKALKNAMRIVQNREAAQIPINPKKRATRARNPAMGWMIKV